MALGEFDFVGCVRVYYEIEGIILYNETGKQFESPSCDIYIKGLTTFTVKLWFEEFEFRNCSREYLEVFRICVCWIV